MPVNSRHKFRNQRHKSKMRYDDAARNVCLSLAKDATVDDVDGEAYDAATAATFAAAKAEIAAVAAAENARAAASPSAPGTGFHSSTSQLNLSRFHHWNSMRKHPTYPNQKCSRQAEEWTSVSPWPPASSRSAPT